jgi:RHS repeat-associated protein
MDDRQRIALVDTRTQGADGSASQLLRYQHGNHLGSASLELDAGAAIVSYEEYHPYGSTALQSGRSFVEVSLKRFRYSGQERDEETGLSDHGARYYAPWLGRWTAADPARHEHPEHSCYLFTAANPIKYIDPDGKRYQVRVDHRARTVTFEAKVYTIDEQSFAEASEVAGTLNRFSRTIVPDAVEYQVKFNVDVVAPPEPKFLESKLDTSLHWKVGSGHCRALP